ncbi:E3 ubiquitin-protein ligase CHFR-like [Limulus polyphemus]|uniref:E3 ubiquitin-protein ligase CHFR n=1 Tax=Limulus polyphemus TaxID=6850 RepID=A0ABM1BGQ7_LIMPO|nr:E3 ubiquitin-protein ligase CHFR-like [Limulus polyphemus]XP_022249941.1 E3 ubiquitin-protein ligase CHFR-like [Limulus polyphemus]
MTDANIAPNSVAETQKSWGELTYGKERSQEQQPIIIRGKKFVIGRAKDCDLQVAVKMVSGHHCYLQRDEEGRVWLCDTSTNGTYINRSIRVVHGQKHEVKDGDELYLIHKKKDPDLDLHYVIHLSHDDNNIAEDCTLSLSDSLSDSSAVENSPTRKRARLCPVLPSAEHLPSDFQEGHHLPKKDNDTRATVDSDHSRNDSRESDSYVKVHPKSIESDGLEEALVCSLCLELLYNPVCLQPCMHCYCSGCYSEWMDVSNECPQCRCQVERLSRNHLVKNLVEAYITKHPEKKRCEEDIEMLNARDRIKDDMLYPKKKHGSDVYMGGYDTGSEHSSDEDDIAVVAHGFGQRIPLFQASPAPPPVRPPPTVCRQCPGDVHQRSNTQVSIANIELTPSHDNPPETNQNSSSTGSLGNRESVSTDVHDRSSQGYPNEPSDFEIAAGSTTDPPIYVCQPNQTHVLCQCCMEPMPDRRVESRSNPSISAQQCSLCCRPFCHMYWVCRKPGCFGCLNKFADIQFGDKCLPTLVNDNSFESQILVNYLNFHNKSWRELQQECIARLESGEFSCPDNLSSYSVLCYPCGLRNFKALAYCYRKGISNDSLPEDVTRRQDCYWGKNCRTQKHNASHAQRFNHICEQTRLT